MPKGIDCGVYVSKGCRGRVLRLVSNPGGQEMLERVKEPQSMPKGIDCGVYVARGCRGRVLRRGLMVVVVEKEGC
jgi:hypothetical protein